MVDFYRIGTEVDEEDDYRVGLFEYPLFTPSTVLDEMNSIKSEVQSLDADVKASNVRPAFLSSWETFRKEWEGFYESNSGGVLDVVKRSLNSTYDKVQDYKKRVKGWRDGLSKEGGKVTSPGLPEKEQGGFPWKLVAWGVAIVGGLIAAAVVAKEVRETVQSIKGPGDQV